MSEQHPGQPNNHQQWYGAPPVPPQTNPQQTFDAYGNPIAPDAKTMAVLAHISPLILTVLSVYTLSFLGPLIFWIIYKDKPGYQFTAANSARAFNFHMTMWIINVAGALISVVLAIFTLGLSFLLIPPVLAVTSICMIVFHIIAAVKAGRGEVYEYPLQTPILK